MRDHLQGQKASQSRVCMLLGHHLMLGSRHDHGVAWKVGLAILVDHSHKGDHLHKAPYPLSELDCARREEYQRSICMHTGPCGLSASMCCKKGAAIRIFHMHALHASGSMKKLQEEKQDMCYPASPATASSCALWKT